MGGGNPIKAVTDTVKGAVSDGVAVATGGIVDVNGGKINTDLKDAGKNFGAGLTGGDTMGAMTPKMPPLPKAEDPNLQLKRAEAEAATKIANEIGEKGRGLSSTILGGSTGDEGVLKKKRLLGE